MPLLPERPLLLSPQLAATLGLEEALLYQLLADVQGLGEGEASGGFAWFSVDCARLQALLPFWTVQDIRRVSHSLRDKGVLLVGGLPVGLASHFRVDIDGPAAGAAAREAAPAAALATAAAPTPPRLLTPDWAPAPDVATQLGHYGVPPDFIHAQAA